MASQLVFVGGAPRSGTTLFQKIIGAHSTVYGGPEFDHLPAMMSLYERMKEGFANQRQAEYYNIQSLREYFEIFISGFFAKKILKHGVTLVSEKTPDNVKVFAELVEIFPRSKFIFIVRDPRAIINSLKNVKKRSKKMNLKTPVTYGSSLLIDLMRIFQHIKSGNQFLQSHPENCKLIYYEDFVTNVDEVVKDVCSFLDIPFENSMLKVTNQDDISKLIKTGNSTVMPFVSEHLSKEINDQPVSQWKKELSFTNQVFCAHYAKKQNVDCLKSYNFGEYSRIWYGILPFLYVRVVLFSSVMILSILKSKCGKYIRKFT